MTHVGWARLNPSLGSEAEIGQKESKYKLQKSPSTTYDTHGYGIRKEQITAATPNSAARVSYERSTAISTYTPRSAYATELPIAGLPKGIYPLRGQTYTLPAVIPKYTRLADTPATHGTNIVPAPLYGHTNTTGIEFILIHEEHTLMLKRERTFFSVRL